MPSFQDSVVIFFIALLIFGPKKLPELARQLGKLMSEFRRASNEFRMQMEDELRISEQAEQQKKIAAMQAAAPVSADVTENTIAPPTTDDIDGVHPHALPVEEFNPPPIATSGELTLMPPDTGLPVASASVSQAFNSIPQVSDPEATISQPSSTDVYAEQQLPNRTTQQTSAASPESQTEAPIHG
jgi:sec-independent protein translocase protein TatB